MRSIQGRRYWMCKSNSRINVQMNPAAITALAAVMPFLDKPMGHMLVSYLSIQISSYEGELDRSI